MKEKFDINKNLRMLKYTLEKDDLYEFLDDVDSKMTKKIYSIIKRCTLHFFSYAF